MKRDMDLIRTLLLRMEASDDAGHLGSSIEVDGFTEEQIGFHCHLMQQAGLIVAADITSMSDMSPQAMPMSLTWAGYEFLEASRDPTLWQRARENVLKPAGGMAFNVLLEWLKSEAKTRLGLPP